MEIGEERPRRSERLRTSVLRKPQRNQLNVTGIQPRRNWPRFELAFGQALLPRSPKGKKLSTARRFAEEQVIELIVCALLSTGLFQPQASIPQSTPLS